LEVDFEQTPPVVRASILNVSLKGAVSSDLACECAATAIPKSLAKLSGSLSGIAGRYAMVAAENTNAYSLIQVLASGRVLWMTRYPGYTGSGSGTLNGAVVDNPSVPFYEGRTTSTPGLLVSSSVLGELAFGVDQRGAVWAPYFGNGGFLEKQETRISKINGCPVYNAAAMADGTEKTGVTHLDFSADNVTPWNSTNPQGTFKQLEQRSWTLTVQDPLLGSDGNIQKFSWDISILGLGVIKAVKSAGTGMNQPSLFIQLDRSSGEVSGGYSLANGGRRSLSGSVSSPAENSSQRFRGWVVMTSDSSKVADWEIINSP
jgi:hypothetical protein